MLPWLRGLALAGVAWAVAGCTPLGLKPVGQLAPARSSLDSVGLEVLSLTAAEDDEELNQALWQQVDEQHFPAAVRQRLHANGLRAGLLAGQLPGPLERAMQLREGPAPALEAGQPIDQANAAPLRRRYVQLRAGQPTRVIVMGEGTRLAELPVLLVGDDNQVTGRTFRQALGLLEIRPFPQPDQRVRLEIVPQLEFGDPIRTWVPHEHALEVEFRAAHESYDQFQLAGTLAPGEMIVIGCLPKRSGSLGQHFFTERKGDRRKQKLILLRLAQAQAGDLFASDLTPPAAATTQPADGNSPLFPAPKTPKSSPTVALDDVDLTPGSAAE